MMRWSILSSRMSLVVVGFLVVLLAVLATLQYRLIAQLSDAERARLQEGLDQSAAGFCEDFDKEIARVFAVFNLARTGTDEELSVVLADRLALWNSSAVWPKMIKGLVVARNHQTDGVSLLCFDKASQTLRRCDWDDDLLPIRRRLQDPGPGVPAVDGALPGLVLPMEEGLSPSERPRDWRPPRDHLVVRFDRDVMTATMLPQLAERHFAVNGGLPYLLSVSSVDRPGETIFRTSPQIPTRVGRPDATDHLFGLRTLPEVSGPPHGRAPMRRPPPPRSAETRGNQPPRRIPPPGGLHARMEEGRWILTVQHPEGSLEDVVERARRRNMAISVAMLVMLGVTSSLMVLSTRKARLLARQQMDFVAAVSHELRTPLTAIRSAGQNLADGIIDDPERVRNYGQLIEKEGRRLTEMIGRVLTFAGIRSGRQIYRMEPVDASVVVKASLEDCAWAIEETGFEAETQIADDLPQINGDAAALRRVFTNLFDNAMKYAAAGRWLGIRVWFEPTPENGEVQISVSDRGPGLPKREFATAFEPFRRGADVAASGIPGSGLGLAVVRSVVEAHGGAVEIASSSGGGAKFTVRLPAVTARPTEREKKR